MTLTESIQNRRSVPSFDSSVEISTEELFLLLEKANLAPSSMNLQPWEYLVCHSTEAKERLKSVSYGQSKIAEASAAVVVLGNLKHHENALIIAPENEKIGVYNEEKSANYIKSAARAYSENPQKQREEAFRGGNLWAMTFMLAAQEAGWDTAPMGGYVESDLIEAFELEENLVPVLIICIGKANPSVTLHPRLHRIPALQKSRIL